MGGVVLKGGCMGTRENGWGAIKGWVHGHWQVFYATESGIKYSQLELLTNPKSN